METEARIVLKKRADEEAIQVFSENVRELLMAAPLGRKKKATTRSALQLSARTYVRVRGTLITV
jgi:transcriptional accessory protein Tex/SPT6